MRHTQGIDAFFNSPSEGQILANTPWKTDMDPENRWLVEENTLPGGPGRQGLLLVFGSVLSTHCCNGSFPEIRVRRTMEYIHGMMEDPLLVAIKHVHLLSDSLTLKWFVERNGQPRGLCSTSMNTLQSVY